MNRDNLPWLGLALLLLVGGWFASQQLNVYLSPEVQAPIPHLTDGAGDRIYFVVRQVACAPEVLPIGFGLGQDERLPLSERFVGPANQAVGHCGQVHNDV